MSTQKLFGTNVLPRYGVATIHLIEGLPDIDKQFCFANDSVADGKLEQLKSLRETLKKLRPEYESSPNASKTKVTV